MNCVFEPPAQRARMFAIDASDQDSLFALKNFRGDLDDLEWCFARAKDNLRETLSQRAVGVHLGEAEVNQRRGLKSAQHFLAAGLPGAKCFQQVDSFLRGHGPRMPKPGRLGISILSGILVRLMMMPKETMPVLQ